MDDGVMIFGMYVVFLVLGGLICGSYILITGNYPCDPVVLREHISMFFNFIGLKQ